jgi:2-oxoglutarate ferredoxin oxidoreductase subunit alpha
MQLKWGTHGDHPVIALAPASVEEMFSLTVRAFNLSEKYRVPVILASDEVIAHMREKVMIPDTVEILDRKKPALPPGKYKPFQADADGIPPMASYGEGYRFNVTGLTHTEAGFPTDKPEEVQKLQNRLFDKIQNHLDDILDTETRFLEDAEIAVFTYGSTSRAALSAVNEARQAGIRAGLIRPRTLWPFPEKAVSDGAKKCKTILCAEMNMGQMLMEVERSVRGQCRIVSLLQVNGELITPETILKKIKEAHGR